MTPLFSKFCRFWTALTSVSVALAITLAALAAGGVSAQAAIVSVSMEASPSEATMDDLVQLVITVKGVRGDLPSPEVTRLSDFAVHSQGQSQNISIVNGAMESSTIYSMILAPKREGTFVIGPAKIQVNGQGYASNQVTVKIGKSVATSPDDRAQKDLFLEASIDKKNPFVGEQVTLTVRFFYAVQLMSQPNYTPPKTTDFWSETLDAQKSYYENVAGRRYLVTELKTAVFPTRPGDLEIGVATIDVIAQLSSRKRSRRDPFSDPMFNFGGLGGGENIRLRSRPIRISARPLPADGKPTDFSGAVGEYSLTAVPDKTETEVNSPVTVKFTLKGAGNIKVLPKPTFLETQDFRVYSGSSQEKLETTNGKLGGQKSYEEVFIPRQAGALAIPGVEFTYFSPVHGAYRTLRTDSIPVRVTGVSGELSAEGEFAPAPSLAVGSQMRHIRYIKKRTGEFQSANWTLLTDPGFMALQVTPAIVLLGLIVLRRQRNRLGGDIAYSRSRRASSMARKRLKSAAKVASVAKAVEFYGEIRLAVFAFVADKRNLSPHGMTIDDLARELANANFAAEEVESCKKLMQKADFARYATGTITLLDIRDSLSQAEKILVKLEEAPIA